jgi:hypothetical protein
MRLQALAWGHFHLVHSPSRHIYQALTIRVGCARCKAFDRISQRLIKVDGTFA